jgi:hypothetical protein
VRFDIWWEKSDTDTWDKIQTTNSKEMTTTETECSNNFNALETPPSAGLGEAFPYLVEKVQH